jgi:O-antigen/teichoic acid export membrane protein
LPSPPSSNTGGTSPAVALAGAAPISEGLVSTQAEQLRRSVFRSSSVQLAGRAFLALSKLLIASLVVRAFGPERYGEYSLVLVLTVVPEWIVDFGLNDIFAREISRRPAEQVHLLRILTASKTIQVVTAYLGLVALVFALRYPPHVTRAALIAGTGLLFYGGVLVYRSLFKATLTLERDVLGEAVSVVVLIPLLAAACMAHASLETMALCYAASRLVFFVVAVLLGRRTFRIGTGGVTSAEVRWGFREAAAIGMAGFLVGVYEVVDTIVLSKMATPEQLGFYSGAQKLVWPLLTGFAVVSTTVFPVLSSCFGRDDERFREYFQGGVDAVILLAAASLSGVAGAATFFTGILGPTMGPAAPVLRVLALLCLVKAVTSTVGPVLYVTGAQRHALWVTGLATFVKATALILLVGRYGAMGAALGSLVVEVVAGFLPTLLVVQHFARCRLRLTVFAKTVCALVIAHGTTAMLGLEGRLAGGITASGLFVVLALLSGAFRPGHLFPGGVRPAAKAATAQ